MKTIIKLLAALLISICLLAALIKAGGHPFFVDTVAYAQAPVGLPDRVLKRLSGMGSLAHLFATGQLGTAIAGNAAGVPLVAKLAVRAADGFTALHAANDALTSGGQAQPSIAVDSTGQHIVIGTNNAAGFGLNPISVSGFQYSDDGGRTFTDGGPLPITTPTSVIGSSIYPGVFGDPEVKYLGGPNFIYFSIVVVNGGSSGPAQTLGFHLSRDFGHTWTGPFEIPPATNPNGLLNGASVDLADKPFADVDPDTGRVLVSWSNFTPFASGGVEISSTFSDNILDVNPLWSTRSIVAATPIDGQSSIPRFAGNGSSNVYLAWQRFPADNNDTIGFVRSLDNGATWSDPINPPPSAFFTMDQVLGDDRVSSAPGLAVDNSSGPRKGNIYLVYSNNNLKDGGDIVFQSSTDSGLSFTSPVLINSRPGNDRAQWFPWITVDNSSGRIYVFYYDQGIDTSGDLTQTTYQFSDDGGLTWKQPMPLTDSPFKAGWGKDQGHPNLGDYNQAVAQNGEFFAAWAGTELLPFTNGVPSVHMNTPKIVFKGVSGNSSTVSLTSNFSDTRFTDSNGNGFIDAGEQIALKFRLTNYVTNPIFNPRVITRIVATLSTAMPTVTIVRGTSGYPSIAPGASATNDTDFIVQLSPLYARGTPLSLTLRVSTNQGSTVLLFTHATGTPQATAIFQEDFESAAPGSLPIGWLTQHVGGNNTVPWTTSNTFNMGNNGAFHVNVDDGSRSDSNRWERLLSPLISVPPESEYVTVDFDVKYDTQDDPAFNILAYDGFLLRVGDYGPAGSLIRAVMAEAFEEEFSTGNLNHYPKHFPRSNSTAYFQDISAWAGDSGGLKHVHLKLNGMAGRSVRLWWEFTQDTNSTCKDVRPAAPACGVLFDNLVVKSIVTVQADLSITKSITSGPAVSGQNITYTIDATNNGPTANVASTVSDDLPPLLGFVSCSVTGGGTCNSTGNHQTITLPSDASGSGTITLVAAISCSAAGGTSLSNTATISSSPYSWAPDPDPSNNFSTATTKIVNPLPVISCPADIVTTTQPGQASAIVNFSVTATDNCPLKAGSIAANPASGSAFLVGTTKVTATVKDSGGDQSSCAFNVSVKTPTATTVKSATQYDDRVILTASVTPTPLGQQTATGTVNFFINGNSIGSGPLNASGVAIFPYTIVQAPGSYSITANYVSTSPFFLSSSGSGTLIVAAPTATGSKVRVSFNVGSDKIRTEFDNVSSAGTTSAAPIAPDSAGGLPGGFSISDTKLAFGIATTASHSDETTTCFVLNSITDPTQFQSPYPLRIMHRELINGGYTLVDRTILAGENSPNPSTKTICAETPSLSMFVFAKAVDFTPPKISGLSLSQNRARVGTTVVLKATSSDVDRGNSNIGLMEYSVDGGQTWRIIGSNYTSPTVTASLPLSLQTGVYIVCVRATDAVQNSSSLCVPILAIYDPNSPSVTGKGWITSAAGKLEFKFDAKYKKGSAVPSGNTDLTLKATGMHFQSTGYEWLVVSGNRAQFQGSGKINGKGDYGILITGIEGNGDDGKGGQNGHGNSDHQKGHGNSDKNGDGNDDGNRMDKVRVKIWSKPDGMIVYDNAPTAGDIESAGTALGGGDITIHGSQDED